MKTTRSIQTLLAATVPVLLAATTADAAPIITRRWLFETAELRGKMPNTDYELRRLPGGRAPSLPTGRTIRTDAGGNGWDWWFAGSGLPHWQAGDRMEATTA